MILDNSGSFSKEVFQFALYDMDALYRLSKNPGLGIFRAWACSVIGLGLGMFIKQMNGGRGIL